MQIILVIDDQGSINCAMLEVRGTRHVTADVRQIAGCYDKLEICTSRSSSEPTWMAQMERGARENAEHGGWKLATLDVNVDSEDIGHITHTLVGSPMLVEIVKLAQEKRRTFTS